MPTNLPSSFASAAAGQNANSRGGRADGRGATSGDWARRDGRSTNGTLTFRRSSTTPLGQPSSQPPPSTDHAVQHPTAESPVSASPSTYELPPARYTKEDLLEMYRPQRLADDPARLFATGWNPGQMNGHTPRGWGKSNDNHIPQEPGACWDDSGDSTPMGLQDMSLEEKEAFNEINSPLKPPTQNKDAHQGGANGRKASLSQGTSNTFGVSSPSSATRPGTRRRETIESNPFGGSALASPTANRFSRDDPSYWFQRSKTDLKEAEADESDSEAFPRDAPGKLPPFGNLMRSNTGGIGGTNPIWPPSNQTTPGVGAFGNFALPTSPAVGDKRVGGAASGSRLAHLIPKDSSDNLSGKATEGQNPLNQQSWRSRPRTDTDPFGDDTLSGSAVLGGAQDTDTGGMSQQANRAGTLGTPVKGSAGDFGMAGLNFRSHGDEGPVSPSETNPYRSPPADRQGHDEIDANDDKTHGASLHDGPANFGSIGRGFGGYDGGDRSQTSSVGAKAYPSLNTLSGWPASGNPAIGTPDRERPNLGAAFGASLFSPMGDLQSPGLSNLNNVFGPAGTGGLGTGSIGRGSKMGSLFPPAMQAQMQSHEYDSLSDSLPDLRQSNPLGAIGRTNFGVPLREGDSPMRANRGVFGALFPGPEASPAQGIFSTGESSHPTTTATAPQSLTPVGGGLPFGGGQGSTEPPTTQAQRTMVMPDRMRWVYLDPSGHVQGPFTGLEMNDWYKANFFTPDLRVKKVEDQEFEPLGQLIRRIGNSREPFLVPQIGIPHGPPTQAGPFSPQGNSGVVPPLSGVFPSFGRTLTAEEQNNLERRKQEEQYLMVQQREFVMRAQAMSKFPLPGPMLQHHSSAHSLQSQPSFGSISSPNPIGMPHQQPIGAMPPSGAFFDGTGPVGSQATMPSGSGNGDLFRDDDLNNLTNNERQVLAGLQGSGAPQPIGAPGADAARAGLPDTDNLEQDPEGFKERLQEFEVYRAQFEAEKAAKDIEGNGEEPIEEPSSASEVATEETQRPIEAPALTGKAARAARKKAAEDALSLTQQVQKTQAAAAAAAAQPVEPDMPMPFPPPASTGTPLPAPTAQRARSNLPEQYNRSQTGTPDSVSINAQPPPLAPWAKDHGAEGHKGPSLKEIQEAEARKAAKAEEAAAAQRKAILEQEAAALREKTAAVANAGLPATSTWGHGSPAPSASPWSKPGPSKTTSTSTPSASASSKKTLAEIQREEELRKQKASQQVSSQAGTPTSVSKSYANLAGKPGQSTLTNAASAAAAAAAAPPGSGWATVGAGGKIKAPFGPSSQSRSVSGTTIKPMTSPVRSVSKPAAPTNGKAEGGNTAMEEFNKWVNRELSRGITGAIDIPTFQAALDVLPLDTGLIADAVYSNSTTMDGRHFAEEFVRRKKLAERGVVEKQPDNKGGNGGGWSEVAKKGSSSSAAAVATSPRDDASMQAAGFKVVPGRKKGKK